MTQDSVTHLETPCLHIVYVAERDDPATGRNYTPGEPYAHVMVIDH
jgi:hypothetical protein